MLVGLAAMTRGICTARCAAILFAIAFRVATVVLAAVLATSGALALSGRFGGGFAYLLPALLLLAALARHGYPGERALLARGTG
jgi:hypothetical protein